MTGANVIAGATVIGLYLMPPASKTLREVVDRYIFFAVYASAPYLRQHYHISLADILQMSARLLALASDSAGL